MRKIIFTEMFEAPQLFGKHIVAFVFDSGGGSEEWITLRFCLRVSSGFYSGSTTGLNMVNDIQKKKNESSAIKLPIYNYFRHF